MFEGKIYYQIDGMAMGSPLGPVLVNLFMGYHEQKWLQSFEECELILYHRYVDDIICLFNSETERWSILCFSKSTAPHNKIHNWKTNWEQTFIFRLTNCLTSVYWKKHSIGLYTNYLSFTPFSYKIGLVKTLLHRAFVISSNWSIFHLELRKTKETLEKNLYPSNFID